MAETANREASQAGVAQPIDVLTDFVERELLLQEGPALDPHTPLIEEGVLDSVSVVALLAFVEERFGVVVPDGEIEIEQLRDLRAIADWVGALAAGADR